MLHASGTPAGSLHSTHARSRQRQWKGFARGSIRTVHLAESELCSRQARKRRLAPSDGLPIWHWSYPATGSQIALLFSFFVLLSAAELISLYTLSLDSFLSMLVCFFLLRWSANFRHSVCFWGGFAFTQGDDHNKLKDIRAAL